MKKRITVVCVIVLIFSIVSCATGAGSSSGSLSNWKKSSEAWNSLVSFVQDVTDKDNPDYIKPEERIAVFDFDGTLFCETDPTYFEYMLLVYRVLEDPNYRNRSSVFERQVANAIVRMNETGNVPANLESDHAKAYASAFAGMTVKEMTSYVNKFMNQNMTGYKGMNRGSAFYAPMVQVVKYLAKNDFTVFIVSGSDRYVLRAIIENSELKDIIQPYQIIGSDVSVIALGQKNDTSSDYTYKANDKVIMGGLFETKNLRMNKVSAIVKEIGIQPVLSFGNSSGDYSMAEYTITNNPNRSLAFMLCCDDLERENGNETKANQMYSLCVRYGWISISMKNDWTTIYGSGVSRLK